MGMESFAVVSGPESVNMNANAGLASSEVRTGGRVAGALSVKSGMAAGRSVDAYKYRQFEVKAHTEYHVEARDSNGRIKWAEDFGNLVTTEGLNTLLDATFKTGIAEPAWFVGLVDGAQDPVYAAADVMAAHSGWIENVDYEELVRLDFTPGTITGGAVDNSEARAIFTITEDGSIAGCFLTSDAVKEATDGILYGVGAFTGGARNVETGDTLRVTSTLTVED
jgi:hypothetical protein